MFKCQILCQCPWQTVIKYEITTPISWPDLLWEITVSLILSGWPSGLRRQTQAKACLNTGIEPSGPRMWAWVQIPLLTNIFTDITSQPVVLFSWNKFMLIFVAHPIWGNSCYCINRSGYAPHYRFMPVAWPSGLRRWFKAPVSSEAWVRIPPLPHGDFEVTTVDISWLKMKVAKVHQKKSMPRCN